MTGRAHGIVCGYDGSPDSGQALDWAAREAADRGTTLTVCHAWSPGYLPLPSEAVAVELAQRNGERVLADGLRHARAGTAAADVRPLLTRGSAARVLCDESASADIVVVGSRGRGGLAGLLLGSVSLQVAAHARGPVVVVRGRWRSATGRSPEPIVVGADGSEASRAAVAFAFEQAALREVPLVVVCALADTAASLGGARRLKVDVEEALAKSEHNHPEVPVRRQVVHGAPRAALLEAAAKAQLLVVGARGRGGLRDMMLGSVSLAMLHHAPCPVSVIRQETTR